MLQTERMREKDTSKLKKHERTDLSGRGPMSKRTAQADSWTGCRGMGIAWHSMAERTKQGRMRRMKGKGMGFFKQRGAAVRHSPTYFWGIHAIQAAA
jgi:hypothetical protein